MTAITRGLVVLAVWTAALGWLAPATPAARAAPAQTGAEVTEEMVEEDYDGCTFRFVNRYLPDRTQQALTRQVRTDDCRFGARNRTIRVRVCFEGPEASTPVDCSQWLRPTSETPYAESVVTSNVPKGSIHYVEIHGSTKSFALPPSPIPALPPAPAAPQPPVLTTPSAPPAAGGDPSPATTTPTIGPTTGPGPEQVEAIQPAPPDPPRRRPGLAMALAGGGIALLGLGGTGFWLLRRTSWGAG